MPGIPLRCLLAIAAALALGGCAIGDDEPTVPEANADALLERLEAVEEDVNTGECADAVDRAEDFKAEVNELPAEVDDELKQALQDGAARLVQLAEDDSECVPTGTGASDDGGVVETTDEPSTPEVPSTPTETETETGSDTDADEPTEETTAPPPAEEETTPPAGDQGDDGGGESGSLNDTGGIGSGGGG